MKNSWLSKYLELKSSFNLLYKRIQKKNNNTTKSVMVLLDTSLSKLCLGQQRSSSFLEDLCCFRNQNDAGRQSFQVQVFCCCRVVSRKQSCRLHLFDFCSSTETGKRVFFHFFVSNILLFFIFILSLIRILFSRS